MMIAQPNRNSRPTRPTMLFPVEVQQLLNVGRVRQAIEVCKRGLIYFPSHVTGYLLLAQAYHDLGQRDRAVNVLRDGYRRTGAIQIEQLRAAFAGEPAAGPVGESADVQSDVSSSAAPVNGIHTPEGEVAESPAEARADETPSPVEAGQADVMPADVAEVIEPSQVEDVGAAEEVSPAPEMSPADAAAIAVDGAHPTTERSAQADTAPESSEMSPAPEAIVSAATAEIVDDSAGIQESGVQEMSHAAEQGVVPVDHEAAVEATPAEQVSVAEIGEQGPARAEETPEAGAAQDVVAEKAAASRDTADSGQSASGERSEERPAEPAGAAQRPSLSIVGGVRDLAHGRDARRGHSPGALIGSEATLERDRNLSLALHTGRSVSRLRSSNLRLIPGLEFAPLRQEEQVRRQPIAPLINEPMPELTRESRREKEHAGGSIPLPGESEAAATVGSEAPAERPVKKKEPVTLVQEIVRRHPEPAAEPAVESVVEPAAERARVQEPAGDERRFEGLTPLEELARRLEKARIPVVEEPQSRDSSRKGFESTIVSETLADILLSQGAYQEALKAFRTLARTRADRSAYFQQKIREIEEMIAAEEAGEGR